MKKCLLAGTAVATMFLAGACGQRNDGNVPEQNGSRTGYAMTFFRNAVSVHGDGDNVLVSPYSAGVALSMLAEGAESQTRDEILRALGGCTFAGDSLQADSVVDMRSANSAWIRSGFNLKKDYAGTLEKLYGASVQTRNFADPATVGAINAWCSDNTGGRITEIVSEISPDMVMFLINALYFKAPWETSFDRNRTTDRIFHGFSGDTKVPMMYAKDDFRYAEYQGSQLVELPYEGGAYSMLVLLPSGDISMNDAVSCLTGESWDMAMDRLEMKKVMLTLPKFSFETDVILNDVLMSMGVQKAFSGSAQFGGITDSSVSVDQVRQKCFIEVNEEGAEAAAVTSISMRLTAVAIDRTDTVVMTVDRPFLFAIVDNEHDNVLFVGRVMNLK